MVKKLVTWKCMILLGVMTMSGASAADTPLKIRSVFDINSSFCAIRTNGVLGMDNRDSALAGRGFGSASTNAMLALQNGENDITIEIGALGWFSQDNLSDEERKTFKIDAGCKVALTAFRGTESRVLSQFSIAIGKDGVPFVQPDTENTSVQPEKIRVKKISAQQTEKGHLPSDYIIDNYYPNGMELYQFSRKVYLKGLPGWKWTKAKPFTGKPEQIKELKRAYLDLWNLFAEKNNIAIRSSLHESLHAWSIATGSTIDDIYNEQEFSHDLTKKSFKMNAINWNDYEIEVMNESRIVRLINKSDPTVSPINYIVENERGKKRFRWYSPFFAYVDGRFIPVI